MNRKMIKALKNKYIYVDIDGTIAEYRFNNHVNAKDGTTNGQTMKEGPAGRDRRLNQNK